MKFNTIYLIAVAFMIIVTASCKKDLANANVNPDQITSAKYDPNLLLTTAQLAYPGATNVGGSAWATKWGAVGCFIQHVASTSSAFYYGDKYINNIGAMGEMFQDSYTSDVQPVIELYQLTANKPQYRNLHQMARIMKALIFEQITDLYGDIPYFQAGLGYYDRIYTPVYDSQQTIYNDLLKEVSQATDSLTEDGDKPTGDIFYSLSSDQIGEWKKFGNSLLLRMAMRLTKIDIATAQTYATKAITGTTMQSNNDNAIVEHIESGNALTSNQDAVQIFGNDSLDLRLSDTLVNNMKKYNDPRLAVVAWLYDGVTADSTSANQIGLPPGYIIGGNNPKVDITKRSDYPANGLAGYSRLSDNILNIGAPSLVVTYAETEFLRAEAAVRWPGITGDLTAAAHYKNGVTAAINQLSTYGTFPSITDGAIAAYYANVKYNAADALEQINTQYWLCTLMDEYECYANFRRSGYPALTPTNYPGNVTSGTIPRRLTYPPSQKTSNLANYNTAVARLTGGDKMTSRVWWDK
ncbi:Starch-binding associating with outer membrane [Mucilaginibacter mallensis]|uniref:Starch-binding associating with outer membrane n=1 Tax=Mucilaginibacter mallensis TaxID=652787 RepID=A0A1H1XF68_MUCMA|nr:SusD/RagB family nutrient-binding outer membrane lipoprotein [Mucilaginibacter mallensis]SDT07874.1 Starch-binding associating with outer membrane [Mucilaginibacter mallensis]